MGVRSWDCLWKKGMLYWMVPTAQGQWGQDGEMHGEAEMEKAVFPEGWGHTQQSRCKWIWGKAVELNPGSDKRKAVSNWSREGLAAGEGMGWQGLCSVQGGRYERMFEHWWQDFQAGNTEVAGVSLIERKNGSKHKRRSWPVIWAGVLMKINIQCAHHQVI